MGYSKEVYRNAAAKLADQRAKAEREAEERRSAFFSAYPRAAEIERQLSRTALAAPFWGAEMCAKTFPV